MKRIDYDSFIAGLLLKLDTIDNIDFSLLVKDFKSKTGFDFSQVMCRLGSIIKYIELKDDWSVSLKDGITLDYFIDSENKTLRDKLKDIAGNIVIDYVNDLDIEKYKKEKEQLLRRNKENVINESNVLLISDIQEDYDELIKYGFKNVDYFKSIIRANAYFEKHPEELKKYHIILRGNQSVQNFSYDRDEKLDRKIDLLKNSNNILVYNLNRYDYPDRMELFTYLSDIENHRSWNLKVSTYVDLFNAIVENMSINHILEKVNLKNRKFIHIEDEINPNRLPLPAKKKDLKILYLDAIEVSEHAERIKEELGLDITFKEDNNYSLGRYVKNYLGDYDIIIASNLYSSCLLNMDIESTEQCKDTGRELTLLVNYGDAFCGINRDLGDILQLGYKFGGILAPTKELYNKEFRVLRRKIETNEKEEHWKKYSQSKYSQMLAIISSSVNFYNETLLQLGENEIRDLDLKTAQDFDDEFDLVIKEERKIEEERLTSIKVFDSIKYTVLDYLSYRIAGLVNEKPDGLKITEGKNFIRVTSLYQDKPLCVITFSKNKEREGLRKFEIQTLSKKGILTNPQTIGLYTSKYENLEGFLNRPDEKQELALMSMKKKIDSTLRPINEEVSRKLITEDEQAIVTLSLKKKN